MNIFRNLLQTVSKISNKFSTHKKYTQLPFVHQKLFSKTPQNIKRSQIIQKKIGPQIIIKSKGLAISAIYNMKSDQIYKNKDINVNIPPNIIPQFLKVIYNGNFNTQSMIQMVQKKYYSMGCSKFLFNNELFKNQNIVRQDWLKSQENFNKFLQIQKGKQLYLFYDLMFKITTPKSTFSPYLPSKNLYLQAKLKKTVVVQQSQSKMSKEDCLKAIFKSIDNISLTRIKYLKTSQTMPNYTRRQC